MIREEIILDYARGKDVLDIGSVGQDIDFIQRKLVDLTEAEGGSKYYLWHRLKVVASSLTGIDLEPSSVPGIVQGDMELYSFNRQFDLIVAGDILEHVSNQGLFLSNVHRHLKPEGHFIVTTPNAKWFTVLLKPNPTHTAWHDKYTLFHLLNRHGFSVDNFRYYVGNKPHYNLIQRALACRQGMLAVCSKKA